MANFADYNELVEPLVLPINGKSYTLGQVNAQDGIKWMAILKKEPDQTMSDEEFFHAFLGDAYDEMLADKVPFGAIQRAGMTAIANHESGREAAAIFWATGADPKAITAYMKANSPNRASKRSQSGAAASKTRTRASSSGTKPPQK